MLASTHLKVSNWKKIKDLQLEQKAGAQERYLFALSRNNFLWSKESQVVQLHGQNQQINFQESNQFNTSEKGKNLTVYFLGLSCNPSPKGSIKVLLSDLGLNAHEA
jgi:hypothetical protein